MAGVVTDQEVQAWLDRSKIVVDSADYLDIELSERAIVYAKLSTAGFDTSTWTDESAAPDLVSKVIAMRVASWLYRRLYSEESTDGNPYADKLMEMSDQVLTSIATGTVDIPGQDTATVDTDPIFYPTDASTQLEAEGESDYDYAAGKFGMGMVF